MSGRIIIDPLANKDLDGHFDFIARDSLAVAVRFLKAAAATFQQLADMPTMGSPQRFREKTLIGLRAWPVQGFRRHRIYYRESANGIEVVRILHGAQDVGRILRTTQ